MNQLRSLDPSIKDLFETVKTIYSNGAAILLSSHTFLRLKSCRLRMAVLKRRQVYDEIYETFLNKAKEEGKI